MKLAKPFYRIPVHFDARRLREETAALPSSAWAKHPNEYQGNSSVRLISAGGGENDSFNGVMLPTAHLMQSPYIRQVLASFGVVWGRSRLMKLAPFAEVRQHADAHHHWFDRVRVHIPIATHPDVRFYCGSECVHMAEGEAWIFDTMIASCRAPDRCGPRSLSCRYVGQRRLLATRGTRRIAKRRAARTSLRQRSRSGTSNRARGLTPGDAPCRSGSVVARPTRRRSFRPMQRRRSSLRTIVACWTHSAATVAPLINRLRKPVERAHVARPFRHLR